MVETIRFIRQKLPHWLVADRTYFVTMRLSGTLPKAVAESLAAERAALGEDKGANEDAWLALHREQFRRVEGILDAMQSHEGFRLTDKTLPNEILNGVDWLRSDRGWVIDAATIMPTHVHIVMRNEAGRSGELMADLTCFKRFSACKANQILGRKGTFWAREDFDHWCRTPDKVESAVRYVRDNPVKAGLVKKWQDWPWTVGVWDRAPRRGAHTVDTSVRDVSGGALQG